MSKPLVSIVTPCFNGEKYLEHFFNSILNQTYPNLELIFINDGSTDRTEEIVRYYEPLLKAKKIRFIYLYQENAGQAAALNLGLKWFTGEYLTWPDSDDEIMPEFIEKKVEFLQQNTKYVYCYGKAISVNESDPSKVIDSYSKRKNSDRLSFFEDILFVNNVFFPGFLVKVSSLDQVLTRREIYSGPGGQNAQLLLPLAWYYGEPGYVDESVYKYYIHEDSHSHSQDTSERIIQQLHDYEKIVISTLRTISDQEAQKYINSVQKYYAKLRFGNAVDTQRADLISKYYWELKKKGISSVHDFMLYVKYTNKIIRRILHLG